MSPAGTLDWDLTKNLSLHCHLNEILRQLRWSDSLLTKQKLFDELSIRISNPGRVISTATPYPSWSGGGRRGGSVLAPHRGRRPQTALQTCNYRPRLTFQAPWAKLGITTRVYHLNAADCGESSREWVTGAVGEVIYIVGLETGGKTEPP